jgi:very-short-patch-repair endonuclease
MVVVSQEDGVKIVDGRLKMANAATTKLTRTREQLARSSGGAVTLSPSEGERAGVRGIPAPTKTQITRARILRKKSSWAEKLLWRMLRNERFSGYKFRRQHPFGIYTLDFYCAEARLVVETDGFQHGHPSQQQHDAKRDTFLANHGIVVKRIWNWRLKNEPQFVRDNLWMLLQERAPHPGNVKPAKRVISRVLNPDRPTTKTPHPALSPSDGERVSVTNATGKSKAHV